MTTAMLALEQAYEDAEKRIVEDYHISIIAAIAFTDAHLNA